MNSTLPERQIGSIVPRTAQELRGAGGGKPSDRGVSLQEFDARVARIIASQVGTSATEVTQAIAHARRGLGATIGSISDVVVDADVGESGPRRECLDDLVGKVQRRFAGKLQLGSEMESKQAAPSVPAHPSGVGAVLEQSSLPGSGRLKALVREAVHGPRPNLSRNQRRVLVKAKRREADAAARRFMSAAEPERGGVWSRTIYRQIRAGVQDASGRAAQCLLYMVGTEQALKLAEELDARVPMDRRKIALWYAINTAPGSELGDRIKLGFALGLWSAVLADPNNPNMERARRFQPSRRTLSTDLSWLQERDIVKRWQVHAEVAAPCEIKRGPYPTNRYFTRQTRAGGTMMAIALALGDIPRAMRPNPGDAWSREDAAALEEVRGLLLAELGASADGLPERPS